VNIPTPARPARALESLVLQQGCKQSAASFGPDRDRRHEGKGRMYKAQGVGSGEWFVNYKMGEGRGERFVTVQA
jgi:hypothetical protein